jgi:GxxExxY protein
MLLNLAKDPRTYAILGAAMAVHCEFGRGFVEPPYREAFALELGWRKVPFASEKHIPIIYKGVQLKTRYRADLICFEEILVEAKAIKQSTDIERAQILNYLKATGLKTGLLINFGAARLEYERFIR